MIYQLFYTFRPMLSNWSSIQQLNFCEDPRLLNQVQESKNEKRLKNFKASDEKVAGPPSGTMDELDIERQGSSYYIS